MPVPIAHDAIIVAEDVDAPGLDWELSPETIFLMDAIDANMRDAVRRGDGVLLD